MRIVICPGMGCDASSNWYRWFAGEMEKRKYVSEIILRNFPDQPKCRESIWIPFLKNQVGLDADTVVVGHSTGAACAMRMLEDKEIDKVRGVILVAAAYTDLGDEWEAASEYFNRPWAWERMREGAEIIQQFHGTDDHLIPVAEGRYVAQMLEGANFQYHELPGRSHFFEPFPELLDIMDSKFGA